MTETVQEINPLDISFSNQKGFQPSTPSQGSPEVSVKHKHCSILSVTSPSQVFDPEQVKKTNRSGLMGAKIIFPTSARHNTRMTQSLNKHQLSYRNPYVQMYETRFASNHKRTFTSSFVQQPLHMHQSVTYESQMTRQRKRASILKWDRIDSANHLKQISRLNNLINKVSTHMSMFNRLYPLKRK